MAVQQSIGQSKQRRPFRPIAQRSVQRIDSSLVMIFKHQGGIFSGPRFGQQIEDFRQLCGA